MYIVTDSMSKSELRELCKQASLTGYSKLTKEEMINALAEHEWDASTLDVLPEEAAPEEVVEPDDAQPAPVPPLPAQAAEPEALPAAPKVKAPKVVKEPRPPREFRNGVGRPRAGGKCAAVWDYLGKHPATTVKELKELAPQLGFNPGNASCEFYVWRKFHGIKS